MRSKFSWLFLKMKLDLGTVHRSVIFGNGTGPDAGRLRKYAARMAKSAKTSRFRTLYDRSCRLHEGMLCVGSRFKGSM